VARDAVSDARVLDLFSGTGALAFEALSRGATSAVAVDDDRRAASAIRTDAEVLGLTSELDVVVLDLLRAPKKAAERLARRGPFDLILADPPYADAQRAIGLLEALAKAGGVAPDALVVLEHASADELSLGARLASVASYRYGSTAVAFLTAVELEAR
jgi:16S rRNA (guanine966-N2)-methyltransferase